MSKFLVAVIFRTDLLINYNSFCNIEGYSPIHFYGKVNVRDALPVIWYIIKHFRRCIVHDDVAFTFVLSRSKNQVFYDITWYGHIFVTCCCELIRNLSEINFCPFIDFVRSDNGFTYKDVIIIFYMKTK